MTLTYRLIVCNACWLFLHHTSWSAFLLFAYGLVDNMVWVTERDPSSSINSMSKMYLFCYVQLGWGVMVTVACKIIFLADVMFTVDWRAALLYRLTPFWRVGDPSAVNTLGMICGLNGVCSPLPLSLIQRGCGIQLHEKQTRRRRRENKSSRLRRSFIRSLWLHFCTDFNHLKVLNYPDDWATRNTVAPWITLTITSLLSWHRWLTWLPDTYFPPEGRIPWTSWMSLAWIYSLCYIKVM